MPQSTTAPFPYRAVLLLLSALFLAAYIGSDSAGTVLDEASTANRDAPSFAAQDENYLDAMDGGAALTAEQRKGRITWVMWSGGNDRFWDALGRVYSFGSIDLLKVVSSHPSQKFSRDNRWSYLGLVNEPCFEKPTGPDPGRFGLWLDKRRGDCAADPFENEIKYPGVRLGSRGKTVPVGSYYGYASGIVGLRLFPNPDFDDDAAKKWDPKRYYDDPSYYRSQSLIRPFRVGMTCAFCHVGPNPTKPPVNHERPNWDNLSSIVGNQYFWVDRIFGWEADRSNFVFQVLNTARPGTLDTSLVSTDYLNNPRTMNAVYELGARLAAAKRLGKERLAGDQLLNMQLPEFFQTPDVWTPRILKDGADSVGALGALNRVYLNIGLFSEEWLLHFRPFSGGRQITPIRIADAEKNSVYWHATKARTGDMAAFLVAVGAPHHLADAPDGRRYLTADRATIERGKTIFANVCARCHSSEIPDPPRGANVAECAGPDYLKCWNTYWAWTKTDDFRSKMRSIVAKPDFPKGNFLSTDLRVPVPLLQTYTCSPLASNAIAGNIWDNFSSQSYKQLPSVGSVTVHDPFTGEPHLYAMPAGGRGYMRPASLVSLWSTAPFLQNNSLGPFRSGATLDDRMSSFDASIEQLLWPERREKDSVLGDKVPGVIERTTARSFFRLPRDQVPGLIWWLIAKLRPHWIDSNETLQLGPIPQGTPVNLLTNLEIVPDGASLFERIWHFAKLAPSAVRLFSAFWSLPEDPTDTQLKAAFEGVLEPFLSFSKCPDFVVNRGHYFGTDRSPDEPALSDTEKRDLIAFLKTL